MIKNYIDISGLLLLRLLRCPPNAVPFPSSSLGGFPQTVCDLLCGSLLSRGAAPLAPPAISHPQQLA